jgi:uncharacterized protein (TIGR01440 family)
MEQAAFLQQIHTQITAAAEELITAAQPKPGQIFVVGCSTSEVLGEKIGTAGSPETAQVMMDALIAVTQKHQLYLAQQCCEHLNRALVVEEEVLGKYNLTQVTVHPVPHAGGSMASAAYETFKHPVVVEQIQAHLGLDIGQTLIGMHLKRVAVPVRLSLQKIGNAVLTAARTRPPLIGGERAKYF